MIRMYHVYKVYAGEISALEDISLHVERGEFVFLTGPSGAGKTTLLELILCAERPTKGQLLVNNRNVTRMKPSKIPFFRRHIGFVFQDFKLLDYMNVFENVAFALRVIGAGESEIKKRVNTILRTLKIESKANFRPYKLSGGEKQRVAIARALVNNPLILLADEPTGNLDSEITMDIMNIFMAINARGTTVIMATHNKDLTEKFSHRTTALNRGRIVGE